MGILTSASALAQGELVLDQADRDDLLATVLDEAHRLDRLVANLLDLSRLQAGAARPEPELAAVDDLVIEALDELAADGARVEVTLADDPAAVRVDSHQIQRALVNLLENALKYSPPHAPVFVRVASTSSEVAVRIIDQGPGVAVGELGRIFEPFQRGSGSAAVRGAGLGLAIAQGFAEANGGKISVESRSGQGATFVLTLPVAKVVVEA
jgi:two-component system sensor histidine kinase KdpD